MMWWDWKGFGTTAAALPYIRVSLSLFGVATLFKEAYKGSAAAHFWQNCLPGWEVDLLTKPGRRILVQFVMTGMLIYLAMAIDLPAWGLKAVGKLQRGFLWRGRKEAKGGTVWWQGARYADRGSLVALKFRAWKSSGGH
jgi:hypothetical protein